MPCTLGGPEHEAGGEDTALDFLFYEELEHSPGWFLVQLRCSAMPCMLAGVCEVHHMRGDEGMNNCSQVIPLQKGADTVSHHPRMTESITQALVNVSSVQHHSQK